MVGSWLAYFDSVNGSFIVGADQFMLESQRGWNGVGKCSREADRLANETMKLSSSTTIGNQSAIQFQAGKFI